MKMLGTPLYSTVGAVALGLCAIATPSSVGAAQQTTPTPAPPTPNGPPARQLPNPDLNTFNVRVRNGAFDNGNFRGGPDLTGPYSKALAFARCAGGTIKAKPIMATGFGSPDEAKLIQKAIRGNLRCGQEGTGVPVFLARAAISETAVKGLSSSAPIAGGERLAATDVDPAISPMLADALQFAQCQVKLDQGAARAVLMTKPGSPQEATARSALFASSQQCGGADKVAGLDSISHRAVIATVLGHALAADGAATS